ncbi:MAG: tetratricopeptide repeat protein [Acidobacteria bacterium]|nr:tetratricopeptide repeat protein [Acidobacteriota bacterium]
MYVLFLIGFAVILSPLPIQAQSAHPSEIAAEYTRRAATLRQRWHLDEAERAFETARVADKNNISALLGLAEIARIKLDYQQSLGLLHQASFLAQTRLEAEPSAPKVIDETYLSLLNSYGILYLTIEDPVTAGQFFDKILQISPQDSRAWLGKATVALLNRDYLQSENILTKLSSKRPNDSAVYSTLAKVFLEQNRCPQAASAAQRALDLDPFNLEAKSVLCSVRVIERNPDGVRKLAQEVLDLNPYNARIRRLFSQYIRSRRAVPAVSPEARKYFEKASNLARQKETGRAIEAYEQATQLSPDFLQAYLGLGACALSEGNLELAAVAAEQATSIDPENALAQLQLSLAHAELHERARKAVGMNLPSLPLPSDQTSPTDIGEVFVNYFGLSTEQQRIINLSVSPFAHLLPELKRRGAKHYLLPLDRQLPEIAGYEMLEDRTTFDGRYYSSIRGVGGLVTVSGIEYLNVVEQGGFNTIAHEFAHQVHSSVFDKPLLERIQALYARAVREGRTLDYYAAANEWEYFAQGYEAYVSISKRPGLGITGRHTRDELRKLDPALYALIEEVANPRFQVAKNR